MSRFLFCSQLSDVRSSSSLSSVEELPFSLSQPTDTFSDDSSSCIYTIIKKNYENEKSIDTIIDKMNIYYIMIIIFSAQYKITWPLIGKWNYSRLWDVDWGVYKSWSMCVYKKWVGMYMYKKLPLGINEHLSHCWPLDSCPSTYLCLVCASIYTDPSRIFKNKSLRSYLSPYKATYPFESPEEH